MAQPWSVLLHLHVPALFFHPFQKPFVWVFFPFVQMESLFQLCNYCSSDFRAVTPLQICAGSHCVRLEKLNRCDFLIAPRVTFVIFSSLVCLREQLCFPGRSSHTCLLASGGNFATERFWIIIFHVDITIWLRLLF